MILRSTPRNSRAVCETGFTKAIINKWLSAGWESNLFFFNKKEETRSNISCNSQLDGVGMNCGAVGDLFVLNIDQHCVGDIVAFVDQKTGLRSSNVCVYNSLGMSGPCMDRDCSLLDATFFEMGNVPGSLYQ